VPLNCGNLGSKRVKFNNEVEQVEYEVDSEEEQEEEMVEKAGSGSDELDS